MLDAESLLSGKPVAPVDASDMKRVWELTSEAPSGGSATPASVGWDVRLIAGQCSQGADPDSERPHHVVFQTLATFPLPEGIQRFRPDEFIDTLRKAPAVPYYLAA